MSKRSKNQSKYRTAPRRNAPLAAKKGKTVSGKVTKAARAEVKPARTMEQMIAGIRVLGFAVALLSIAGALYWAGSRGGSYPPLVLAGLTALGFLAGFGLFIAVRAREIAQRANR